MNHRIVLNLLFCFVSTLLSAAANSAAAAPEWRFEGVARTVAVGDVHGDYHGLIMVLQKAGVIDQERDWAGGEIHLVVAGDMVDRGPASLRVLDFLMRLQVQAEKYGGRVHTLLGNHEVMVLGGDLRYASPGDLAAFAGQETSLRSAARSRFLSASKEQFETESAALAAFEARYPPGYFGLKAAYSQSSKYGRWLATRPVIVMINDTVFVHGGLSGLVQDPSTLNLRAQSEFSALLAAWQRLIEAGIALPEYALLDAADALKPVLEADDFTSYPAEIRNAASILSKARKALVFHPEGPLWYRGNAVCNPLPAGAALEKALAALGASRLVVSHSPTRTGQIEARLNQSLLRLDTGERPSALMIDHQVLRAVYADLDQSQPVTRSESHPLAGVALTAGELESMLKSATIVAKEDVGTGVTKPVRLTLEQNGVRLRAIFKSAETPIAQTGRLGHRRALSVADRHVYDIAAYRVDRLLSLNMVPVTVARTVNGQSGSLQYWVEDAVNERRRRNANMEPDPVCPLKPQYDLLELFDRLIYNTDRTQENILYTPDWRVALIDHSRSFRVAKGIPEAVREVNIDAVPGFGEQLAGVDEAALRRALDGLLDEQQIWALLARRDEMLAEWRANAATIGEISSSVPNKN